MQTLYECCAGLDVQQRSVVARVRRGVGRRARRQTRTFGTMTADLEALAAWLREQGVEQVALESTGVYWWPVFNLLEEAGLAVVLVNPQHVKRVPGRKTDVKDAAWLAALLQHGLLRASFIPPAEIRTLRELTRYRKAQVQARTAELNRLQKVLESANLKLASVASDVWGASGQAMLAALVRGEEDPEALAGLAQGSLRAKLAALAQALSGRVKPHHRALIGTIMEHVRFLEGAIERLDAEIARLLEPLSAPLGLLLSIPGLSAVAAAAILAEVGPDMGRWPSAGHLASWAGVCPGNRTSGGKAHSGKTTKGNKWLRGMLGEVAWAAIRKKGTSFGARYRRLVRRLGAQKAVVAVMHHLLLAIYRVLHDRVPYRELGPDYYRPDPQRTQRRLVQGLERLGFTVTLTPTEAA